MTQPNATDPGGRHEDPLLSEFVAGPDLAKGRLFDRKRNDLLLDVLRDPILWIRLAPGLFNQGIDTALLDQLSVSVERVSRLSHHFAGTRHVAQLLRKIEQTHFVSDDFLLSIH